MAYYRKRFKRRKRRYYRKRRRNGGSPKNQHNGNANHAGDQTMHRGISDVKDVVDVAKFSELHHLALKLSDTMQGDEDIRKQDLTAVFWQDLHGILIGERGGGLVNINVNGTPGIGKSTIMGALLIEFNNILGKKTTKDHILANQIVYTQVMRRVTEPKNEGIGIDEMDELGQTGYNATVDQAAINHYSDLHRANYIHKIACSPQDMMDKNCFILLDALKKNPEKKTTHCLLSYIFTKSGSRYTQLLGYVDIDVSKFIGSKLEKDYQHRKMERLKLISKYGIRSEKDIMLAKIMLHAYKEIEGLASIIPLDKAMCEQQIDISTRHYRGLNSILAEKKYTDALYSITQYDKNMQKLKKKADQVKKHYQADQRDDKIKAIQKELKRIHEQKDKVIEYWENAAKLEPLYLSALWREK